MYKWKLGTWNIWMNASQFYLLLELSFRKNLSQMFLSKLEKPLIIINPNRGILKENIKIKFEWPEWINITN